MINGKKVDLLLPSSSRSGLGVHGRSRGCIGAAYAALVLRDKAGAGSGSVTSLTAPECGISKQ